MPEAPAQRLFFAVWPDKLARDRLHNAARQLHHNTGGRLTRADTIHLTLAFLGNVPTARLPEVQDCAAAATARPFAMTIDRFGWWKHNRIVWAMPSHSPEELVTLVRELEQCLEKRNLGYDRRPAYVPHITLVRKAQRAPVFSEPVVTFEWKVSGFALMRSVLSAGGSSYEPVGTWALA